MSIPLRNVTQDNVSVSYFFISIFPKNLSFSILLHIYFFTTYRIKIYHPVPRFKFSSKLFHCSRHARKNREKTRPFANSQTPFHPRPKKVLWQPFNQAETARSKPRLSFIIRTDPPSRFHYIILFNIHPRNHPKITSSRSRRIFDRGEHACRPRHPLHILSLILPLPQFPPLLSPSLDQRFATVEAEPRDRYVCGRFAPVDKFDKTRNRSFLTGANRYSDRFIRRIRLVSRPAA